MLRIAGFLVVAPALLASACGSSETTGAPSGPGDAGGGDAPTDQGVTQEAAPDVVGSDSTVDDAPASNQFTDPRDSHQYTTVDIGGATWMGENLAWAAPSGSFCYELDDAHCATGGRLYTFDAASTACPVGWHLSTDDEWKALETALGMPGADLDADGYGAVRGTDQGTQLKAGGTSGLNFPMTGYATVQGDQATGWDGLSVGVVRSYIWTSTPGGAGIFRRRLEQNDPHVFRFSNSAGGFAITVRCVADA